MTTPHIPRADTRDSIVQPWSPSNLHDNFSPRSRSPRNNNHDSTRPSSSVNNCGMEIDSPTTPMSNTPPTPGYDEDRLWRDNHLNAKIMERVEANGITRPRGHKVSFHYNSGVEDMHFGKTHPMKPWRLTLTKHLILANGLQYAMDTFNAVAASKEEVRAFHDPDYVDFLSEVSPQTFRELSLQPRFGKSTPPKHEADQVELGPFNLSTSPGADCPVFDGMSTYLFLYTGATLEAARQLISNRSDIAVNWSGGLHHAHKSEASGFCYINDIVLAILEMLRVYSRVLYIDIDVHHGDGVEEAFQRQPRVMTLSFHRYGPYDDSGHKFFPGTGDLSDVGLRGTPGENFALNVPIGSGIDDRQYSYLFESVVGRAVNAFKPSAIVLQCGADSLGGDRLGQFNINIKQHGECISFVKRFHLPLLLLGGGGYTARNVARAWAHETALATDNVLPDKIPVELIPRKEAFEGKAHGEGKMYPSFERLHKNECKDARLEEMVKQVDEDLRRVRNSPWVLMDALPAHGAMEEIMEFVEEKGRKKGEWEWGEAGSERERKCYERERKWRERDPAGRGELR